MTWFRCGGGSGIPAALKNMMNAVFNKKFGTAVDYPAEDWPDDVNLLGPLPEGTASGNPAIITDGADQVPTKSVVVNLPASLSGVSAITETQTGKNLIDLSSLVDGYVNTNGTFNTNHSNGEMRSGFIPVKPNTTYYFSIVETTGTAADWVGIGEYTSDDMTAFIRRDSFWRFTTSATAKYIVVSSRNLAQATKIQLEIGNDPTTWEAYTSITQYTAQLGRTIYGGQADIVNGEGQELVKKITVSSFTGTWGAVTNGYAYYISDADTTHSTSVVNPIMMQANQLFTYGSVGRNSAPTWQYGGNDGGATVNTFILPSEYDTLTKANNFLASLQTPLEVTLTLATPTDFTFDGKEINTRLGYNAFWSDQGDTEVTYRRDIDLALQTVSNNRGLMMASRPAIEPSNGDQESEESTENNIETEGDENAR